MAHIQTCAECRQALASVAVLKTLGSPAQRMQPSQKFLEDFEAKAGSPELSTGLSGSLLPKLLLTAILAGLLFLGARYLADTDTVPKQQQTSSPAEIEPDSASSENTLEPLLIEKRSPAPVLKFDAPDKNVD